MRSLMTLAVLMPMTFAVAQAAPAADRQLEREETRIQPFPYPRHCPEGTHRAYDEYASGYICVPNNEFEPRPLPWCGDRMKELSGALGGDDMSAKGAALNGLFDAVQSRKSDTGAVPAGAWGATLSGLVASSRGGKPGRGEARFILIQEPPHRDMIEETGQSIQDQLIGKAIDKVIEKVENTNKRIDEIGNGLRSDGDAALQKGSQAQKDAERKHGK